MIDIVTEGSSLVNNYKSQFHRAIQKDGFEALLKRMKDKLAKGQASKRSVNAGCRALANTTTSTLEPRGAAPGRRRGA